MSVSIIIPVYNDSEYLIKTVASCLVQDVDAEIIVVADAPTKPIEPNVYGFMACCGVSVVHQVENRGLADARDAGIRESNGDFILPLDTGDWLYPHVLGKMVDIMSGADVVYGNMTEKDGGPVCVPPGSHGIDRDGMLKMNQLWCTSMFRKALWEKVGGYANGLHTSYEDYTFWNKCVMAGARFKYVNKLIYHHTYNPNSMLITLHKRTDYYNELARKPLWSQL